MPDPVGGVQPPVFISIDPRIKWRVDPVSAGLPDDSFRSRGIGGSAVVTGSGLVVPNGGIRYVALEGARDLLARTDRAGCLLVRERLSDNPTGLPSEKLYELWGIGPGKLNLCATDSVGRCFSRLAISVKDSQTKLVHFGFFRDRHRQTRRTKADIQRLLEGANKIFERQTNLSFADQTQYVAQEEMWITVDGDLGSAVRPEDAWKWGFLAASKAASSADLYVFFIWELQLADTSGGDLCGIHKFHNGHHIIMVDDGCAGLGAKVLAHEFGHALTHDRRDSVYDAEGHSDDSGDLMFRAVRNNPDGIRITFAEANIMNRSGT